jgi:uncharacterized protein
MMHNLAEVSGKLRDRLTALYGARLVRLILFGSQARGDAEPGSDVDVLVVLQGPVSPCEEIDRTLDVVAEISLDQGVVIACVFVSEDQFYQEQSPLLLNVRQQGIAL